MNDLLLEKILKCPRLPSLPAIALEVIELCRHDDINIKQIARTISNDPALSSKILRTVNSAFYGLSQPVGTISHALVILGLNSVKTLALGFTLVQAYKGVGGESFDVSTLWRRVLYSAVGARSIAQKVKLPEVEEIFLAALLQDLGVMAMLQTLGPEYVKLLIEVDGDWDRLWVHERKNLDLDHPRVGEAMAKNWKLPPVLVAPIRYHEQPESGPTQTENVVKAVALGSIVADIFVHKDPTPAAARYRTMAHRWFGFGDVDAKELLEVIGQGTQEIGKLFDIKTGSVRDPGEILEQANEVLLQLSLQSQQSATELEQQNRQLQHKAVTDALTGAANRGHFNEQLQLQFVHAQRQIQPLSLILMDADKFKSVNDTHGHLAGDKVLIKISETMRTHAPEGALVARYGGEEFVILMPNTDRRLAAQTAERLRTTLAATDIPIDDNLTLRITASMGVACFDGVRFFKRPEQLVKASDQAVYAAKAGGRNCVRIFTPKVAPPPGTPAAASAARPPAPAAAAS
jgi:diguanylate cyclase (GGDEF)-like protein